MIRFYYSLAPNPMKVALFLEEAGLEYEAIPVDTRKGEQFTPGICRAQPEQQGAAASSMATRRCSTATPSCSISARRPASSCPRQQRRRRGASCLSWLMFVASGVGPYSGQSVHFRHYAPEPKDYARQPLPVRGAAALRHPRRAAGASTDCMLGEAYTIVDMAVWGWAPHGAVRPRRGCVGRAAEPQAAGGRGRRAPRRRPRAGAQGPARLQDRARRGGAPPHVPPRRARPDRAGGMAGARDSNRVQMRGRACSVGSGLRLGFPAWQKIQLCCARASPGSDPIWKVLDCPA